MTRDKSKMLTCREKECSPRREKGAGTRSREHMFSLGEAGYWVDLNFVTHHEGLKNETNKRKTGRQEGETVT